MDSSNQWEAPFEKIVEIVRKGETKGGVPSLNAVFLMHGNEEGSPPKFHTFEFWQLSMDDTYSNNSKSDRVRRRKY